MLFFHYHHCNIYFLFSSLLHSCFHVHLIILITLTFSLHHHHPHFLITPIITLTSSSPPSFHQHLQHISSSTSKLSYPYQQYSLTITINLTISISLPSLPIFSHFITSHPPPFSRLSTFDPAGNFLNLTVLLYTPKSGQKMCQGRFLILLDLPRCVCVGFLIVVCMFLCILFCQRFMIRLYLSKIIAFFFK